MKDTYDLFCSILTTFSFDFSTLNTKTDFESVIRDSLPVIYQEISSQPYEHADISKLGRITVSVINEDVGFLSQKDETRLCFEVAFILMFQFVHRERIMTELNIDMNELLEKYPEFIPLDEDEKKSLLLYRNVMKVAMHIIPAKNHKNHLLEIVTRMTEGRDMKYVTGSGQTAATTRRVQIYEIEGGITPQPRPPRKPKPHPFKKQRSGSFKATDMLNFRESFETVDTYESSKSGSVRSIYSVEDPSEIAIVESKLVIDSENIQNGETENLEWLDILASSLDECQVSPTCLERFQSLSSVSSTDDELRRHSKRLERDMLDCIACFTPR